MGKFLILTFTTTLFLAFALSNPINDELPDKPGHCKINGAYVKKDDSVQGAPGECTMTYCLDPEENTRVFNTCPVVPESVNIESCIITEGDDTKPYPDCCKSYTCIQWRKT